MTDSRDFAECPSTGSFVTLLPSSWINTGTCCSADCPSSFCKPTMASYGLHENGLRDEPVKKQAAAEYKTGKESDGVPTAHQVQANDHEMAIDSSRANRQKILLGSQLLQDGTSGSLGQKGLKRFARTCLSVGRMKSFKNLKRSRHARRQSAKTSCACCRGSCVKRIEALYALSLSSVTGVKVGDLR